MTALVADRTFAEPGRSSWTGGVLDGLLAALERPGLWVVSLAGFLARGGLVAFLLPIVILPTPARLQAEIAPLLVPVVFGQPSPGLVALALGLTLLVGAWLILGGLVGAWADILLVARISEQLEDASDASEGRRWAAGRWQELPAILLIRLLAHLPLVIVLAWGAVRIVQAAYNELVTPFEVTTPLVIRIVSAAPEALLLVAVAWWLGEAAGGLAVRARLLSGAGIVRSIISGWLELGRRPAATLGTLVLGTVLVVVAVVPGLIAAGAAWDRLRTALYEGRLEDVPLPLLVFVGLWLGGLVLAAVSTAIRSAWWTVEWRRRRGRVGTIGVGDGADRGGWPPPDPSGTL